MRHLALLASLCIFLASCQKIKAPKNLSEAYGQYISGHTSGSISATDALYIRLSQPVSEELVGTQVSSSILQLTPRVKGQAIYQDRYTILYRPSDKWAYDQQYTATLHLHRLIADIDPSLATASFSFSILPIRLKLSLDQPLYEGSKITVSGSVSSTEPVKNKAIENVLSASQNNKNLAISWEHYSDTHHRFTLQEISRVEKKSSISLSYNGKSIDPDFTGVRKIDILPKGVFQLVEAVPRTDGSTAVDLVFSDQVGTGQVLDGLVRVADTVGKYRYDVNGNVVTVYLPTSVSGAFQLLIDSSVKNTEGSSLMKDYELALSFEPSKPQLKLAGKGVIVPNSEEVIFPFEAQNLNGATVEIFKIFQNNVLQFLQYQRLDDTYNLHPVGRIIHQQHIDLTALNTADNTSSLQRYTLDLSKITRLDPGAIYQVRIGYSMADVANYPCEEERRVAAQTLAQRDGYTSIMSNNYGYNWNDRDNPCKSSYYRSNRFIARNVVVSNLGIISKRAINDQVITTVTDLRSVEPIANVKLSYYDYQQQLISTATTDGKGLSTTSLERQAAFIIAENATEYGYLDLQDRNANSLSDFNVAGHRKSEGIDGYLYGERGVWRPGDTLFLNFMLENKGEKLPAEHPVSITVYDARGKSQYTQSTVRHTGGIYHFPVPTRSDAATGNWRATVTVGGKQFMKTLKVETVKPNRIKLDFDKEELDLSKNTTIALTATWLHGAPAASLRTTTDLSLRPVKTTFDNYGSFLFDDPARTMDVYPYQILDGTLDENGQTVIELKKNKSWLPAGKLKARLDSKIFEKGGNFSIDSYTIPANMYSAYVGINLPTNRWGSNYIDQENPEAIDVVLLDKEGRPLKNKTLQVGLYEANWNWWYDRGRGGMYRYNSSTHLGAKQKATITTDSKGAATYSPRLQGYGNYLVRICDEDSGHCTGGMFYTGHSWRGSDDQDGPSQLIFKTDKESYTAGEDIRVSIPSTADSKLFFSIENGQKVLQAFWLDGKADVTEISIPTTVDMNSNIYLHAHLVQPHNDGTNDLPMRMYGVVPVTVIDPSSTLSPTINMPDELEPNSNYTVTIAEKDGTPMEYTLAVVDEGLLSLTRYKTPAPWDHFYSKQALGVKTWDLYDFVLDGYGGALDQYISIGGDAGDIQRDNAEKVNRFKPVVTHLGPFSLAANKTAQHTIPMPNYVGAVRLMVVARSKDKYGHTDKTVTVKKPLMVQSTLPRVLGPNETLKLPANIWAMEESIRAVDVSVKTSAEVAVADPSQSLLFAKQGDRQAYFDLTVGPGIGSAQITTSASSGRHTASETLNIAIRNPNPYTSEVQSKVLQPGESWTSDYNTFGSEGTNEAFLEVSNLPPMNFGRRLQYLIRYPYGCVEQTTSAAFPQLYLDNLADLSSPQRLQTDQNIIAAITRLAQFQQSSGGFSYWTSSTDISSWGSTYASHFLLEARDKGYPVPSQMIKDLVRYLTSASNTADTKATLQQAYRLFVLAKAGAPDIGAMNRLRKQENLSSTTSYTLAAAYALIGQQQAATQLIAPVTIAVKQYTETGNTYGSHVRDMAMIAMTMHTMGKHDEALQMATDISKYLSTDRWYSTHSTAYALLAVGQIYSRYEKDDLKFDYSLTGNMQSVATPKSIYQKPIAVDNRSTGTVTVKNTSTTVQFAKVVMSGQRPPEDSVPATQKHISLALSYKDVEGNVLDPSRLQQGTDFTVTATITNLGTRSYTIEEIALSQIFPSGWEIENSRITNGETQTTGIEYQDVRDDRVYSFFDLGYNQKLQIKLNMTATYAGRFYMPPAVVEAMYDNEIQATTAGQWVEVGQ